MFKRVFLVLTLLFAQSAMAQQNSVDQNTLGFDARASKSPVVAVESAIGSVEKDEFIASSTIVVVSPAEVATTNQESGTSSLIVTGPGAPSTSSTSTVSITIETEESTSAKVSPKEPTDKIFSLVFAGFEDFVERVFGWK